MSAQFQKNKEQRADTHHTRTGERGACTGDVTCLGGQNERSDKSSQECGVCVGGRLTRQYNASRMCCMIEVFTCAIGSVSAYVEFSFV